MLGLTPRRDELQQQIKTAHEPPALLHPSMTDLYGTKVEQLAAALQREDTRLEASDTLRGLVDSIVLTPEKGQLRIELRGNLSAMLTVAQQTERSPENWRPFHADTNGCGGVQPTLSATLAARSLES